MAMNAITIVYSPGPLTNYHIYKSYKNSNTIMNGQWSLPYPGHYIYIYIYIYHAIRGTRIHSSIRTVLYSRIYFIVVCVKFQHASAIVGVIVCTQCPTTTIGMYSANYLSLSLQTVGLRTCSEFPKQTTRKLRA